MFLVKLPDAIDVLTMSMMYGAITSLYTFKSVVGIGSSSQDFEGAAHSTGGSHLSHTAVKPDSHLAQIFCQNCFFSLYKLM